MSDNPELETEVVEDDGSPEDVLGADALTDDEPVAETPTEEEASTAEAPEGAEEPEQDTETEGDAETVEEPAEPPEQAEPETPELVTVQFEQGGKTYEVELPADKAAAFEAVKTTASQFPHLQQKYTETLEQLKQPADVVQPTAEQPAQVTPEQFREGMKPYVDQAVKAGTISEDFAELYPHEAAWGVWLSDAIMKLNGVVGPISQTVARSRHDAEVSDFKTGVYSEMQKLAGDSPQVFGDLSQPTTREAFLNFMVEVDLPVNSLVGENAANTLRRQWGAYRADELQAAAVAAAERARVTQEEDRRNAGGAGGGGGARSKPKDNLADITEILSE